VPLRLVGSEMCIRDRGCGMALDRMDQLGSIFTSE
jgi:hypothetical protein